MTKYFPSPQTTADANCWKSKDTVPRDGSKVLLGWWDRSGRNWQAVMAKWDEEDGIWQSGSVFNTEWFTHWAPIPTPPLRSTNATTPQTTNAARTGQASVATSTIRSASITSAAVAR